MSIRVAVPAVGIVLSSVAIAAMIASPSLAYAMPHCGEDLVPATCGGSPTPKPTPPLGDLTSTWFTPDWSQPTAFSVRVEGVPESALTGVAVGEQSHFRASVSCTNGFFVSSALTRDRIYDPTLSYEATAPTGLPAGSCLATVWDAPTLRVLGVTVLNVPRSGAPGEKIWSIVFD